ncbi:flavin reductase (DIM6/NTAB) family NADH-FMN oxidoreductase RutF [Naumannella cuiyingiana]|uniref:Flavin reductase (DIM6/NTAB) family NADH-FMN oxidoreductase RutF n=1 Tax=Naumannella cuiyingiana TaxID=1347891 RepID=A0A7Z0D761_9ACTN|nr:flavin reductase family protein [Naumannella cuiyingiana]NYI70136.1 flavin reductase (DIM6/NTAB) family NADH-FMN oxidoreductase RutF [Naumannella cuiyingiana]
MRAHRTITPSVLYFGTPVAVVSSSNADGSTNLAPISSFWALGNLLVIGLGATGHTAANLRQRPQLVLNLPEEHQWEPIERLGRLTGAHPVPADKPADTRHAADKFAAAGWSPLAATTVAPARVAELAVHLEARVTALHEETGGLAVAHARCSAVHVDAPLTVAGTSHVDPLAWRPLIYSFRHYFALGRRRGIAGRAETQH